MNSAASPWAGTRSGVASLLRPIRRHAMIDAVGRALQTRCGVFTGQRILLGVSGGADSLALLLSSCVLSERKRSESFTVVPIVAYVHHHLREAADEDQRFVTNLCRTLDVPCFVEHVEPEDHPGSLAANARELRYRALEERAQECAASAVAVGHHADDQLETMLMVLCRGGGVDGLRGMRWRRRLGQGTPLVRPLLGVRRRECEELCRRAGLEWRDDASNVDVKQPRALLRHEVIPLLEQFWPDAARRASSCAEQLDVASELVEATISRSFGDVSRTRWSRASLCTLPAGVIAAGLRRAAKALAPEACDDLPHRVVDPAAQAVRDAHRQPRRFTWPAGIEVLVTAREVRMSIR